MSVPIGILLGLLFILAYRIGIQDGKSLAEHKPIKKIEPLKAVAQAVSNVKQSEEKKKIDDLRTEGINNLLNYTGDIKKAGG